MKRFKIEAVDSEGNPKVVYVLKPTTKHLAGAKRAANKAFRKAWEDGGFFRKQLDQIMRESGSWDDEQQAKVDDINRKILENTRKLKRGGMDLEEAKQLALQIRRDRAESLILLSKSREFDALSIEGAAENESFDYLVSVCVVDEEGAPIFENVEDYLEKSSEDYATQAASKLYSMVYASSYNENWEKELPENAFLLKYKFCNDDLSLVNEEGKLVSVNGRLIDENGNYRTADGGYEDVDHIPVDKDGNYLDAQPFTKNGESV